MLKHNIIIQITVIFIWAPSDYNSNMAIRCCILIYISLQYIMYISSLQQTRYDYYISHHTLINFWIRIV
jgi:hypothetical protein